MSKINLTNYEAFLLDYVEQRLSAEEVAELLLFLEQHPELKHELDEYEEIHLPEEKEESAFRLSLPALSGLIDKSNCEDYFIAAVEGILNAKERKELDLFLYLNPQYRREYDLYQQTRLQAEEMPYPHPESLLAIAQKGMYVDYPGKEKRRKGFIIWIPAYSYMAAAASFALLIGFWYFFSSPQLYHVQPSLVQIQNPGKETAQAGLVAGIKSAHPAQIPAAKYRISKTAGERQVRQQAGAAESLRLVAEVLPAMQALPAPDLNAANKPEEQQPSMRMQVVPAAAAARSAEPSEESYPSLGVLAARQIAPDVADEALSGKADKHLGLAITKLAARAFNRVSGRKIQIKEHYNDKGVLVSYAINTGNFEYARAGNK